MHTTKIPQDTLLPGHLVPGRNLAFCVIILLFVTTNIGAVFFQLRGLPASQVGLNMFGYQVGVLSTVFLLDFLVRDDASLAAIPRAVVAFLLLLPPLYTLIYFHVGSFIGTPLGNISLMFLWGMTLAVSLRFFFRHTPSKYQALYLGLAMGAGHLCWALIMPMAGGIDPESVVHLAARHRFLDFLNMARALICAVAALLVWKLAGMRASTLSPGRARPAPTATAVSQDGGGEQMVRRVFVWRVLCLLLPSILCCIMNGFMGFLFMARLKPQASLLEFVHLGMALLFPLAGLVVARKGVNNLRFVLGGAALCFAFSPLVLLPSAQTVLAHAIFLICATAQMVLLFAAMLALARFLPFTRHPALLSCLPWLTHFFSLVGSIVAAKVLPFFGLPPLAGVCVVAALCVAVIPLMLRAFPLPEALPEKLPERGEEYLPEELAARPNSTGPSAEPPARWEEYLPQMSGDAQKIASFAVAFDLEKREIQVLEGIARDISPERHGQELGISEKTIRYHQTQLFQKTGQTSRRRLAVFFRTWEEE
jgi:Response regulator containing a CheY-like receiver domain and an HTH DNA-binding domain